MASKKQENAIKIGDRLLNKDGRKGRVTSVYPVGIDDGDEGKTKEVTYGVRVEPTDTVPGTVSGIWKSSEAKLYEAAPEADPEETNGEVPAGEVPAEAPPAE